MLLCGIAIGIVIGYAVYYPKDLIIISHFDDHNKEVIAESLLAMSSEERRVFLEKLGAQLDPDIAIEHFKRVMKARGVVFE